MTTPAPKTHSPHCTRGRCYGHAAGDSCECGSRPCDCKPAPEPRFGAGSIVGGEYVPRKPAPEPRCATCGHGDHEPGRCNTTKDIPGVAYSVNCNCKSECPGCGATGFCYPGCERPGEEEPAPVAERMTDEEFDADAIHLLASAREDLRVICRQFVAECRRARASEDALREALREIADSSLVMANPAEYLQAIAAAALGASKS